MMSIPLVIWMSEQHNCLHEEQLIGQSRAIERLNAEMDYKRERLDDLKEDNRRMESKIDKLGDNFNNKFDEFIKTSNEKDDKLDKRLTKIETKQEEQEKALEKSNQQSRDNYLRLGAVLTVVSLVLGFATFFLK